MYRIINADNGAELGTVDSVCYIGVNNDGCYIPTDKQNASGVLLNSVPYSILGHDEIKGYGTVFVEDFDGGELITKQQNLIDSLLINALEG